MKIPTNKLSSWGVVLTISATLILAACGSDPGGAQAASDGGVASLGSDAAAATTTGEGTSEGGLEAPEDRDEAFLLFDKCMAEQGFATDLAGSSDEPQVDTQKADDSKPSFFGPGGIEIAPEDRERYEKANQACEGHLANVQMGQKLSPEQQAAMDDALLKVEQCMHEKGFDNFVMNIGSDGEEVGVQGGDDPDNAPDGPPVDLEELDQAVEECSKVFDEYPELDDVSVPGREQG